MTVNKENLKQFFEISRYWDEKLQRLLGAIGFEFEVAERAFDKMYQACLAETNSTADNWIASEHLFSDLAILSRTFLDHSIRLQKILKSIAKPSGELFDVCECFYEENRNAFSLRDSLHHVDTRLDADMGAIANHPTFGDFSWIAIAPPDRIRCYWLTFGPIFRAEFASPAVEVGGSYRTPIDKFRYRAFGYTVDLGDLWIQLDRLVLAANGQFEKHLDMQLQVQLGATAASEESGGWVTRVSGRLEISGVEVS